MLLYCGVVDQIILIASFDPIDSTVIALVIEEKISLMAGTGME